MGSEGARMVKAGKRTYFFDVKETKTGEPYLTITESRLVGRERERVRIAVFADALDDFVQALNEVADEVPSETQKKGQAV